MDVAPVLDGAVDPQMGEIIKSQGRNFDRAAVFLAQSEDYAPLTPEQEKALKRKIDRWMIPMLLFTATLVSTLDSMQKQDL